MSDPRKPTGIEAVRVVMAKAEEVHPASVSHLFGDAKRLKPRAQAILDATTWAGSILPCLESDYLIKGWLNRGTVSVVYGPSNVGKSFLAVDLAHHISKGFEWGGRRVAKGRVLYIAAEGGNAFRNRVAALDAPEFFVLSIPLTLTGKDSAAVAVAEVVQHLGAVGGAPFDLIVIDTMARVMGGLDENAAPILPNWSAIWILSGASPGRMSCWYITRARIQDAAHGAILRGARPSIRKSNCPATIWGRSRRK